MKKVHDLTGRVFGRLCVYKRAGIHITLGGSKKVNWECVCECVTIKTVMAADLKAGKTLSCGCLGIERRRASTVKSSLSGDKVYIIWANMKARCNNQNNPCFKSYGGRGIHYDSKWETFEGFYNDMKDGYIEGLSLDRINPNENYCKSNCRWVTLNEQKRNNRKYENNTSGKTGVEVRKDKRGRISGYLGRVRNLNGKHEHKYFSIGKYGEGRAFYLASKFRDEQIRLLNEQGAGYSEYHGK